MKKADRIAGIIFLLVLLLLMYLPILVLLVYSFTKSTQIGSLRGFSLQNYRTLFTTPELLSMIGGTLLLAFGSAAISTVLGTFGAIGTFYSRKRTRRVVNALTNIPVINADVVSGFSMCVLLVVVLHISKDTYVPLVAGHVLLSTPFVYLSVLPKMEDLDPSLYEAALDLFATPARALCRVILPLIRPGILSGFGLALTLSMDDYFITTYTKPASFDTISTYVVNATRGSQTTIKTALWALSTVIFAVVVLIVFVMNFHGKRKGGRIDEKM